MRPLAALGEDTAARFRAVLFDLDDTVLTHGQLSLEAYSALWSLAQSGLLLAAVTGRGAGWGEVLLRQWPIAAVVAENGAVRLTRDPARRGHIVKTTRDGADLRRGRLDEIVAQLRAAEGWEPSEVTMVGGLGPWDVPLADDNAARLTDVTFDIGETWSAPAAIVTALRARARDLGARTTVSSVHLHVSLESDDKASGALALLRELLDLDPAAARGAAVYVGDSENDASAFACFSSSFGVANVASALAKLTVPPRYVASRERGAGFAEIVATILDRRRWATSRCPPSAASAASAASVT